MLPVLAFCVSHPAPNVIRSHFLGAHIADGETSTISSGPGIHCSVDRSADPWFLIGDECDAYLWDDFISKHAITKLTVTSAYSLMSSVQVWNMSQSTSLSAFCSVASDWAWSSEVSTEAEAVHLVNEARQLCSIGMLRIIGMLSLFPIARRYLHQFPMKSVLRQNNIEI